MRRQGWGLVQHALINNLYPDKNIPEVCKKRRGVDSIRFDSQ